MPRRTLTHSGRQLQPEPSLVAPVIVPPALVGAELFTDRNTPFGYMFPAVVAQPENRLPISDPATVIQSLTDLASAMTEQSDLSATNSAIPAGYTYWGQFVDHDITATRFKPPSLNNMIEQNNFTPLNPDVADSDGVFAHIKNGLDPILDLDSVYADGPAGDEGQDPLDKLYEADKIRFRLGDNTPVPASFGVVPDPQLGTDPDLPRKDKLAVIGDIRNDENTIVAQLHTAFLKFHNKIVDILTGTDIKTDPFAKAQELVRWHYQWLTVNDWLRTITLDGVVDDILLGGNSFFLPTSSNRFMPLEFAVAAFRFGHSMVRAEYDFNLNFNPAKPTIAEHATFDKLFIFTGGGGFRGLPTLPTNWIIEWDRFFERKLRDDDLNLISNRFTRKIDTNLALPLTDMNNEGPNLIMRHLAQRNLRRGYLLSIPTGQAVAVAMGIKPLSAAELQLNNSAALNQALTANNNLLLNQTPLWYYVLKEAEVRANGQTLGELGSRIVAETIIGLLRADDNSYLKQNWDPSKSPLRLKGRPLVRIFDLLRFAGVAITV